MLGVNPNEGCRELDYKMLGKRIKMRRRELDLTQGSLAEAANISVSFVGHIERGEKKASIETLAALSDVLDMDLNYMILGVRRDEQCVLMKKEIQAILDKYR